MSTSQNAFVWAVIAGHLLINALIVPDQFDAHVLLIQYCQALSSFYFYFCNTDYVFMITILYTLSHFP